MKDVIIIGSGGHGAEIDEYIKYNHKVSGTRELNVVGFLDDNPANYARYKLSAPLLGGIRDHKVSTDLFYIIGIANLEYRRLFVEQFLAKGARFCTFIHCKAYVSESSHIGTGSVIAPNVNLGPNVRIGNYSLINSRSSMGHDTVVGDFNFISPNVCFSGFTRVGDDNLFGINSATIPNITVGSRNKIAAGMVLGHNVGDDSVVFYKFREKVMAIPKGSQNT